MVQARQQKQQREGFRNSQVSALKFAPLQIELHTCLNLFEPSGHVNTYIDQHVTVIRIVQGQFKKSRHVNLISY